MNNRFAALIEKPIQNSQVSRTEKRDNNKFRDNYEYSNKNTSVSYSRFKEKSDAKNVKKDIKISIDDLEMFPSLGNSNIETKNNVNEITFIDKLKSVKDEIHQDNENILKDGWISLTRENNNQIIYDYSKYNHNENDEYDWETITKQLNENYEIWKQKYIDTWGEDEFHKMYKFPNYDYYYFDKLDQEYENEISSMFHDEEGESSDYHDNYNYEYDNDDYF